MDNTERGQGVRQRMLANAVVEKTWKVPAYEGMGPVTMTLRLPEVKITDSEGRYIVISPRQTDLVGVQLSSIVEWLREGDEDWMPQG